MLRTVASEPDPLTKTERLLIRGTIRQIVDGIPDEAFTGLQTKAGVKATASSCFEKTREEGGTIQAISDIVLEGSLGRQCQIVDLVTGHGIDSKRADEVTTGEYVFWRSLEEVLATPPEDLKKVYLVVTSEPGKTRSVTKGAACLKVVLDVINAICAWPLAKGVASSSSGMGKEAHAWNFVKSAFAEFNELVFAEKYVEYEAISPSERLVTRVYHDVFVLSTDYETATDYMLHEVADIVSTEWMHKCGIPPVLEGIVRGICYTERDVLFTATGWLQSIGEPTDEKTVRKVRLRRGVLMGDPLTKVALHLVNICVRELSFRATDSQWLGKFCRNPQEVSENVRRGEGDLSTTYVNV
jgi:hypothetical protein